MSESDFTGRYGPWAVITGGSEGVGAAFAFRLAEQGINLILVARKAGPLEEVAAEIRVRYDREVITLSLDLTDPDAVEQIIVRCAPYESECWFTTPAQIAGSPRFSIAHSPSPKI